MLGPHDDLEIIFIRHTAVDAVSGLCYGQLDVPLQVTFEEEAKAIAEALARGGPWDAIITSPLSRCKKLAQYLAQYPAQATTKEPFFWQESDSLKELNFGIWEGKLWDQLDSLEVNLWMADFVDKAPPSGESFRQLKDRAISALTEIQAIRARRSSCRRVLCVTHAGVIRALLCSLLQIPLDKAFQLAIDYGGMSSLVFSGDYHRCDYINRK